MIRLTDKNRPEDIENSGLSKLDIYGISTSREILGTSKLSNLDEIFNEVVRLELENPELWLKKLEAYIFEEKPLSIYNFFMHIYNQSISTNPYKPYIILQDEYKSLPSEFSRYFSKIDNKYSLNYRTIDRVRASLQKNISMLKNNISSRHFWTPIWIPEDNNNLDSMVPSLIGFGVQIGVDTNGLVIIRSNDIKFLPYDIWYFLKLILFVQKSIQHTPRFFNLDFHMLNMHRYKE